MEALLAPISEGDPAGSDPRADTSATSPYYKLKDARSAARAAERRAETEGQERALLDEWQTILKLAPELLTSSSKDLEIAVWYLEALVRAQGFAGLRDGFALLNGLVDRYWDTFHSLEDEEGLTTRLAPITGLNGDGAEGALIAPLRRVPITLGKEDGPFSVYHYQQAYALAQVSDAAARAKREAAGAVTLDRFKKEVTASGGPFYVNLVDDIAAAAKNFEDLTAQLDAKAGQASPPSSSIKDELASIATTVQGVSKDLVASVRPAAPAAGETPAEAAKGNGHDPEPQTMTAPMPTGVPRNREDALDQLLKVADFFRQTEPHSPISTTLEEVVRRARLPFADLLAELLPDANAWRAALTNAGIRPPPPAKS
ncbi:MAG TPA: type VI secretion system protein TssA [Caulobacteraceae bacterium]|nr:type VI secretion system protein TssA [Caulobacteraceae bacterium]